MKIKNMIAALCITFAMVGCHKMTFVQDNVTPAPDSTNQRYVSLIYGLVEFSDPVNLQNTCSGGWGTVKTEVDFVNGLLSSFLGQIASFQNVETKCAQK